MADTNVGMVLPLSADIRRLENALREASKTVDKQSTFMERRASQMKKKLEDASKIDLGKALDNVFDSTRLKVLDSGVARIGLFGSALEPLGPLGIAAAAGIAAVGAALAGAREAAKFADDIGDVANRLHVTTDALQEFRYANRAAGGEVEGADQALEAFSITLGKAQQGLAKGQRPFLALGFTKAQIAGFKDAGEALDAVVQKIAGLSNVQKDAVIDQLGLDGLKPLIAAGADEMTRLRDEAHKLGLVMDAELVKRGGELNDQFETVQQVIDVQLKSALVDLGPILLGLLDLISKMAKGASDIADAFKGIEDQTNASLNKQKAIYEESLKYYAELEKKRPLNFIESGRRMEDAEKLRVINGQLRVRAYDRHAPRVTNTASASLIPTTKGSGSATRDLTGRGTDAVNAAQTAGERAVYQALLGLTDSIETRTEIQKKLADLDLKQAMDNLDRQKREIEAGNSTQKTAQLAGLEAARAREIEADALRRKAIDVEAAAAEDRKSLDRHRQRAALEIDTLRNERELATSRKERRRIELEVLARQKKIDDEARAADIADQRRRAAAAAQDGTVTVVSDGGQQMRADQAYQGDVAKVLQETEGPLAVFIHSMRDLDDTLENAAVSGLDAFNQGVLDVATNSAKAGDVLKSILNSVLRQIISGNLQKVETGIFNLFTKKAESGKAIGGPVTAGRTYVVGEHGRELFTPPINGNIVSNANLNRMAQGVLSVKSAAPAVIQPINFDLTGAVVTQDLLRQMNRMAARAQAGAVDQSRRALPGHLGRLNTLGTV